MAETMRGPFVYAPPAAPGNPRVSGARAWRLRAPAHSGLLLICSFRSSPSVVAPEPEPLSEDL